MPETQTATQYEVRYVRADGGLAKMGFFDDPAYAEVYLATLRASGFEPQLYRRDITRIFSDWEPVRPNWEHTTDGTGCASGPVQEGDSHCLDHDRAVKKSEEVQHEPTDRESAGSVADEVRS